MAAALVERLPNSTLSWKFGNASLQVKDKVFAFTRSNKGVAMKLPELRAQELVAAGTAELLRMGPKTMREWIVVPESTCEETLGLLEEAQAYVASLSGTRRPRPAKKAAKKGRTR